jgi:hypothetical protein
MKANQIIIQSICAAIVGASSILLVYWLHDPGYLLVLALFILLSFIFSFRQKQIPVAESFLLLFSNYVAGFFCIPSWGELLPIELILLFVYWGILCLIGLLGFYLGGKYNVSNA